MSGEGICGTKRKTLQKDNTACAKDQGWEAEQCAEKLDLGLAPSLAVSSL